ncbi:hypothetical protein NDU88_002203 [Pleurodeles waltl]|uniref:Uncharacterized protein n=1 Tax=Pleurodeles waltl TaxID=8319 RepID=A0AAV7NCY5_PLEWA|nr:hypothetical protein NDU88_002203 [Pleurodeles waltl]
MSQRAPIVGSGIHRATGAAYSAPETTSDRGPGAGGARGALTPLVGQAWHLQECRSCWSKWHSDWAAGDGSAPDQQIRITTWLTGLFQGGWCLPSLRTRLPAIRSSGRPSTLCLSKAEAIGAWD